MWFDFESLPSSPLLQLPSSHHQSSVNSYFCFSVPFLLVPFCKFLLLTLCVLVPLLPMTSFFSSSTIPFFWSSVHNRPDSGLSPAPQPQLSENNWMLQHHCKIWPTYIYVYNIHIYTQNSGFQPDPPNESLQFAISQPFPILTCLIVPMNFLNRAKPLGAKDEDH